MDIEEIIARYLGARLDMPVSADVPSGETYPDRFVTFERTGGSFDEKVIDHSTVAIQCWGESRYDAKNLAYDVDTLLRYMPCIEENVMSADRNSLYNFPDPESRKARYQIVYEFIVTI